MAEDDRDYDGFIIKHIVIVFTDTWAAIIDFIWSELSFSFYIIE